MTYEEAIKYAKDIHFCTGCPIDMSIDGGKSCKVCEHKAFFELAIGSLEKQNKYGWHDLRKDPNDLPKHIDMVQVCWVGVSNNWYESMFWDGERKVFSLYGKTEHEIIHPVLGDKRYAEYGNTIAWREIEPFGGVNE